MCKSLQESNGTEFNNSLRNGRKATGLDYMSYGDSLLCLLRTTRRLIPISFYAHIFFILLIQFSGCIAQSNSEISNLKIEYVMDDMDSPFDAINGFKLFKDRIYFASSRMTSFIKENEFRNCIDLPDSVAKAIKSITADDLLYYTYNYGYRMFGRENLTKDFFRINYKLYEPICVIAACQIIIFVPNFRFLSKYDARAQKLIPIMKYMYEDAGRFSGEEQERRWAKWAKEDKRRLRKANR